MGGPAQRYKLIRGENGYAVISGASDGDFDREMALRAAVELQGRFLEKLLAQENSALVAWQKARQEGARARMVQRNLQRQLQRELSKQGKQQPKGAK